MGKSLSSAAAAELQPEEAECESYNTSQMNFPANCKSSTAQIRVLLVLFLLPVF